MLSGMTQSGQVAAMRRFNRWYTRQIGVLDAGYLKTPFSLAEGRVMFELANRAEAPTASGLCAELTLDPGYLSRILRGLERRGLVSRVKSSADSRSSHLSLTAKGRREFASLDKRTEAQIGGMIDALPPAARQATVGAMRTIEAAFGAPGPHEPFTLRQHRPGDMGWIVHRQGALYAQEYGWDETFEALCARICADFIDDFDPKRERCWVAERDGEILGSIFCVAKTKRVAKLRLLYVEPTTRGMGIGTRLVDECIAFARKVGYKQMTLWTQNNLHAARRIYERAGFTLTAEKKHHSFGKDLVAQVWDLTL